VLRKLIRKAKEMYSGELLSSSTNKSKSPGTLLIMKLVLHPVRNLLRLYLKLVSKL